MCGITGFYSFSSDSEKLKKALQRAVKSLSKRGPDYQNTFVESSVGLGHARLSIIDTSEQGHQPMMDESGRYILVYNGEIYNHDELKKRLPVSHFQSTSDTEVLLYLLIHEGPNCLNDLNGFFAFAFYDRQEQTLLLARDRMGIKPLHFYQDEEFFLFGSELKALMEFPIGRELNHQSLYWYLKLNYLPGNMSMLQGATKLDPGHYLELSNGNVSIKKFATAHEPEVSPEYLSNQNKLVSLLEESVKKRLMSDVPLGSFLSGGTDSSAIVALATRHHSDLSTFSIGYADHPFFDETQYAELVAKRFGTNHTTFKLTNDDLLNEIGDIIDYIDEPFADSSAIPTYILSRNVRNHVTVALSGDGADELFGGYYKHQALAKGLKVGLTNQVMQLMNPIFTALPQSRSGKLANTIRRANKFGKLMKLDRQERYWFLASLTDDPWFLLRNGIDEKGIEDFKKAFLSIDPNMSDYLMADQQIVLPGDMLTKVDLMSMANSLEVRVPFLDKSVVDFANQLPADFKVNEKGRKRIVQDAFRKILPEELYQRPKKGFEVPLLHWMQNELLSELDQFVFNARKLDEQGLFNTDEVLAFRKKLLSNNPGDVHGIIWALYVFQKWYDKHF